MRLSHKEMITGSNPVRSTIYGSVAQRIEQLPSKQLVVGSNPARATIIKIGE